MKMRRSAFIDCKLLHKDQYRDSGEPFFLHCIRVEAYAKTFFDISLGSLEEVQTICLLHDVVEDTDISIEDLRNTGKYPDSVLNDVLALTNEYTKEKYPEMKRQERKIAENDRLKNVSTRAKFIKMCDRLDNLHSCSSKSPRFIKRYVEETLDLLHKIKYRSINEELAFCLDSLLNYLWKKHGTV